MQLFFLLCALFAIAEARPLIPSALALRSIDWCPSSLPWCDKDEEATGATKHKPKEPEQPPSHSGDDNEIAERGIDWCPDLLPGCNDEDEDKGSDEDKAPKLPNQLKAVSEDSKEYMEHESEREDVPSVVNKGDKTVRIQIRPGEGEAKEEIYRGVDLRPQKNNSELVGCKYEKDSKVYYQNVFGGYYPKESASPESDKDADKIKDFDDCKVGVAVIPFKGDPSEKKAGEPVAIGDLPGTCLDVSKWSGERGGIYDAKLTDPKYITDTLSHCLLYTRDRDELCGKRIGFFAPANFNMKGKRKDITGVRCF